MAFSKYQLFLIALMLASGTFVTLTAKLCDLQTAKYRNGMELGFNHPFFQAWCMFLGEALCLIVFQIVFFFNKKKLNESDSINSSSGDFNSVALISGNTNFNPFIFLPPAMCDMLATSLGYTALTLTYASSFQMLNGAIIIVTGLFSVAFLGSKLQLHKWLGIFSVVLGLAVIGICDYMYSNDANSDTNGIIAGDLLILCALIVTSTQLVYEEKYVSKHNIPPLKAVGWEGVFGFTVLGFLLIPMYYIKVPALSKQDPDHRLESVPDALYQLGNNSIILASTIVNIFSIGFVNFAGISVTKELSATTRVVTNNLRTVLVWVIALALSWEEFHALQLLGFAFLVSGILLYNNIVFKPLYLKIKARIRGQDAEQLIDS